MGSGATPLAGGATGELELERSVTAAESAAALPLGSFNAVPQSSMSWSGCIGGGTFRPRLNVTRVALHPWRYLVRSISRANRHHCRQRFIAVQGL